MLKKLVFFVFCLLFAFMATGQEMLPKFSASLKPNGKIIISWRHNYEQVSQISIQRSNDSLKNFTTLLTVPDASVTENGFVDAKAPNTHMYYRLFIVFNGGKYFFTKSKQAVPDSVVVKAKVPEAEPDDNDNTLSKADKSRLSYVPKNNDSLSVSAPDHINSAPVISVNKIVFIKKQDSLIGLLAENSVRKFRDSILSKTKDTMVFKDGDTIFIKPFVPKEVYKISAYVFTNKDGNIMISLPDFNKKKYSVKFLETDATELFELKEITRSSLIVDKTNFVHAGWFRFELYEDGRLKEKNKLFLPKEF